MPNRVAEKWYAVSTHIYGLDMDTERIIDDKKSLRPMIAGKIDRKAGQKCLSARPRYMMENH